MRLYEVASFLDAPLCLGRGLLFPVAIYFFFGFAVFAACLKALAVGAPAVPGLRIFSPDPSAMRFLFAAILL